MIGNRFSAGSQGYTILEEGQLDRASLALVVQHYLVCRPDGEQLDGTFPSREAAEAEILRLEKAAGSP